MRFNRTGKKNRVSYRIVLQEHTQAPGKRHVEILGSYDPHTKISVLREERIQHWLKEGVQSSDAVYNLLVSKGLVEGKKRVIKMDRPEVKEPEAKEPVVADAETSPAAPAEAEESAPAAEETSAEAPVETKEPEATESDNTEVLATKEETVEEVSPEEKAA